MSYVVCVARHHPCLSIRVFSVPSRTCEQDSQLIFSTRGTQGRTLFYTLAILCVARVCHAPTAARLISTSPHLSGPQRAQPLRHGFIQGVLPEGIMAGAWRAGKGKVTEDRRIGAAKNERSRKKKYLCLPFSLGTLCVLARKQVLVAAVGREKGAEFLYNFRFVCNIHASRIVSL